MKSISFLIVVHNLHRVGVSKPQQVLHLFNKKFKNIDIVVNLQLTMVLFGMAITFSKSPSIAAETRFESSTQHFGGSVWVMGEWSLVSESMDSGCHELSENV